ncbi:ATP-dependent RecD-like DNA helicase [Streptococcus mutans]|uniref:SF1B family DNA helicase RecD2 n=1 Tax=Streptococcus mutans TaxID=1309 RepID=UPI0002B59F86|nr:ATP-dependent RecD-like DNA helicase [Streptococcus mutans]EMC48975.1 putative exodeoxyribonuclease V, conjugation transfer protein [Streptococcus mutans SA41]EMC51936.1 putative exodeoxyribonuclease V, conjugation transfer protein [Streptococcus mutans S1B]KZM64240.1 exodeoxyribonuclease V subunit alpha [Streptococcus mutans]MCB4977503.1 ATP-dependent RecD-like DNA helicase [Streptococcus mutans]MDT9553638.1 ATP-dependent RecD-like DNA helicase [Streptococcus mutans]
MTYYFSGTIDRVIFENTSNFFKIILLEIDDTDSDFDDFEIIVTGTIADVIEGENYTFWGELTQHPKYGQQLKVERYQRAKPSSAGLIKYFSSQHFKGIGKKTAEKIIHLYGDDPIDNILEDPDKLESISGLSKANRENLVSKLRLNYGAEQILAKLAEYGLNNKTAVQIFERYKEESLTVITENPYQLVEDIQGIGFKMADKLAEQVGINSDAPQRFRAALVHTLLETSIDKGDTYIEAKELLEKSLFILEEVRQVELDPSQIAQELTQLISEDKVQNIGTKIFDNTLFYAESGIHKHLTRILDRPLEKEISSQDIQTEIKHIQAEFNINYDKAQKNAIQKAIQSKVFLLTGGPGTGKTTVINGIIKAYANLHQIDLQKSDRPIILAAPTGRAARRMNELTGLPSATIHRHLGLNGDSEYQALDDFLDCDLIIIDEFSMVDTWLANQLFSAIASNTQIVIVGDSDQLPSVGPGQVLADLLKINRLPQVSLTKIFRQSEDSTIVTLANQIRQGRLPTDFTAKKADRSYFEAQSTHIPQMIQKIVSSALKSGIDAQEIQILAPMYRGQAGITHLNKLMQDLLNPLNNQLEFQFNDLHFRKGDKVLHLINDAQINVFNGDIGYITDLIPAKYTESKQDEMILDFDGTEINYPRNEWLKITLAYAMSIHKSQGSEFKVVILPVTRQSGRLLQRNLIYTAITRSKSKLVMLGEIAAFDNAIKNEGTKRKTYLIERFKKDECSGHHNTEKNKQGVKESAAILKEDFILTERNILTIDPMIGLSQADIDLFFKK